MDGFDSVGHHEFKFALYPHAGTFAESDVVREALNFNVPLLTRIVPQFTDTAATSPNTAAASPVVLPSLFEVRGAPNVVLDTVKAAEGDPKAVICRFYEAYGGRASVTVCTRLPVKAITVVNLLEEHVEDVQWLGQQCAVAMRPFQVCSRARFRRAQCSY